MKKSTRVLSVLATITALLLGCSDVKKRPSPQPQEEGVFTASACPSLDAKLKETEVDCPFAGQVRDLGTFMTTTEKAKAKFMELAPEVAARVQKESALSKDFKMLWGASTNFDEGMKAIILNDTLYDALAEIMGNVPARNDRVVHAGTEHTYGYLFSNLLTAYGYKRLRWVRPDIEQGFGLSAGTIAPFPTQGGLFANVTYFAGSIAFRNEPAALKILDNEKAMVASNLVAFNYSGLKVTRLEEIVALTPTRTVALRTDFVPFTDKIGDNAEVLIYSVLDSDQALPSLITMFPVAASFRNGPLNPTTLGDNQKIQTRYNAFVPGWTAMPVLPPASPVPAVQLTGTRKVTAP